MQVVFPNVGLWLCDATVIAENKIRFHVANHGKRNLPEQEFTIEFHPWVKRRSLIPEVTFDLEDVIL